jgi:hypothetical protein
MKWRKWVGLFVRNGEVRPLTIQVEAPRKEALDKSVVRHVNEWVREGWTLVTETEVEYED